MYFALEYFLDTEPRPPVGAVVVGVKDWWRDSPIVPLLVQDYFARRAGRRRPSSGRPSYTPSAAPLAIIRAFLDRVNDPMAAALIGEARRDRAPEPRPRLSDRLRPVLDRPERRRIPGRARRLAPAAHGRGNRACSQPPALAAGERRTAGRQDRRSCGSLAGRLAPEGWTVFEAGGADLMAGQQWFGQLEGRIRQTRRRAHARARSVIWYIPDIARSSRAAAPIRARAPASSTRSFPPSSPAAWWSGREATPDERGAPAPDAAVAARPVRGRPARAAVGRRRR